MAIAKSTRMAQHGEVATVYQALSPETAVVIRGLHRPHWDEARRRSVGTGGCAACQPRLEIIRDNPIGNGLDAFRASFSTVYADRTISRNPDALGQLDKKV